MQTYQTGRFLKQNKIIKNTAYIALSDFTKYHRMAELFQHNIYNRPTK